MTQPKSPRVTRRAFLATSAAAGLAATRAQGLATPRVRAGIIGQGAGGQMLLATLSEADSPLVPVAITARNAARATAMRPDVALESRWEKLLDRDDVDAVLIAAPDHCHAEMAAAALRAGKHVYLLPPLTRDAEEARQLESLAIEQHCVLQVAMDPVEDDRGQRAKQALSQTGDPLWIQLAAAGATAPPDAHWQRQRECSHGLAARSIFNMLYPLQYHLALDAPDRATALGGVFQGNSQATPDGLMITLRYGHGATVVLSHRPPVPGKDSPSCLRGLFDEVALPLSAAPGGFTRDLARFSSAIAGNYGDSAARLHAACVAQVTVCDAMEQWARCDSAHLA